MDGAEDNRGVYTKQGPEGLLQRWERKPERTSLMYPFILDNTGVEWLLWLDVTTSMILKYFYFLLAFSTLLFWLWEVYFSLLYSMKKDRIYPPPGVIVACIME